MRIELGMGLLVLGLLSACGGKEDLASGKRDASAPAVVRQLAAGDILQARIGRVSDTLPVTATLAALNFSEMSAEVEGRVREVRVREGEAVKAGQVLAVLDSESLGESVKEQQAQLDNQQARQALARIKLAKQRELYQQGFISKLAIDELESDYRVREGEFKAQAAQLARATRALADTRLRAPISGVLYQRKINAGDMVARNQKVLAVADLSVLEAVASVPSRLIAQVKPGQQAQLQLEGSDALVAGEVVRINPVANAGTRSFNVYIRVANDKGVLKAGQFVKGGIVLQQESGMVNLPLATVREREGKPWVMLVSDGRLSRRDIAVQLVSVSERQLAVTGLQPGERVLASALAGLKAGDRVQFNATP
ncbi:efflux RND transporter periplasmic adaptor subunit [Craterilacuibacter sp.]|uniref:efflux RND transporter periplasmic adaptor subunit n=1 Tax=Craterilacuibacter sp. TaxID=2870909 RepID=UPI003F3F0BA6